MKYISKTYELEEGQEIQRPVGHPTEPITVVKVSGAGSLDVEHLVGNSNVGTNLSLGGATVLTKPLGNNEAYGTSIKVKASGGPVTIIIAALI